MKRILQIAIIAISLMIAINTTAKSALNDPVIVGVWGQSDIIVIHFSLKNDIQDLKSVHFLHAVGKVEDRSLFKEIHSVPADMFRKIGNNGDSVHYTLRLNHILPLGDHSIYIMVSSEGETAQSNIANFTIQGPPPQIHFTKEPCLQAKYGVPYYCDLDAESNQEGVEIKFALEHAPEGMTIDESTGEINWVPNAKGFYQFAAKAYSDDPNVKPALLPFNLKITLCDKPATIKGSATDLNDQPIKYGMVNIFDVSMLTRPIMSANIINGSFEIKVDEGTYIVELASQGYYSYYYNGASDLASAERIAISCDQSLSINAKLRRISNDDFVKVSGYVFDRESNDPVEYARVQWMNELTREKNFGHGFAITNADGYYEVLLNKFQRYYGMAFGPLDTIDQQVYEKYFTTYWDNQIDPTLAVQFNPQEDKENINFNLISKPSLNNSITGFVKSTDGTIIPTAHLILYRVGPGLWNEEMLNFTIATYCDDDGLFKFSSIVPGEYVIMTFPNDRTFVPGYYLDQDVATRYWKDATKIDVRLESELNIEITLQKTEDVQGVGRCNGHLRRGKKGEAKIDNQIQGAGDAIAGGLVYAVNQDGKVVSYSITGTTGEFALDGLANDSYTIQSERIGYYKQLGKIEIENNQEVTHDFELSEEITSVGDDVFYASTGDAYPNPSQGNVRINFNSSSTNATIKIVDARGNEVHNQHISTTIGNNAYDLNTGKLANGTYYINILDGTKNTIIPVTIVR